MTALCVDLWSWHLTDPDPTDLSDDERARADRFVFAADRDRYIAGRARLRHILGRCIDRPPAAVAFRYGPYGKPVVAGVAFNLSHTGDLAVLATGPAGLQLGADIEAIRSITMDVARLHFAPAEVATLQALPPDARVAAFYRCWTRKEAYLKARGTGLSTDLCSFAVTLAPGDPARLTACTSGDAAAWALIDLDPAPGVAGALAVRAAGRPVQLVHHDLDRA